MVLITGATGFLGSFLATRLVAQGENPVLLRRSSSTTPAILQPYEAQGRLNWREGDLLDIFSLERALEGITKVYNCAALVSFDPKDAKQMLRVNVEGTANLMNYSIKAGVRRLLHVSSVAAVGDSAKGKLANENSQWEQNDHTSMYALSKFESQREVWRGEVEGLQVNIVNPSIILGEPDWNHGSGLLFNFVRNRVRVYPPGANAMIWVEDVVDCMQAIMDSDLNGEQFILSAENMTYKAFFDRVAQRLDVPAPTIALKPWMLTLGWRISRLFGIRGFSRDVALGARDVACYDSSKAAKVLKYSFTPIMQVIDHICTAYEKSATAAGSRKSEAGNREPGAGAGS